MKRMTLILWLLLSSIVCTFAYDFQSGDLYYSITSDNTVAVASGDTYSELTSVIIPESVTYNGTTYSVTSIGENAFGGCFGMTSVTIPNCVTTIGDYAFFLCLGLTSVTIPDSVTSIGEQAFSLVPNIVYSGTATGSPWGARSVNGYIEGCLVYSDAAKTTLLACNVAATGTITIPNSVTTIGNNAFCSCANLTYVTIPNSVTSIGELAFCECIALISITIPNSVTSIGDGAFLDCSNLTSVTCYAIEPPKTYSGFEDDMADATLYVPVESIEKYKVAEEWKNFKEILPISAMPADVDEPLIDPESTIVTITWPAVENAIAYTIEISKDGTLVCTLTFDANGVLQNMRFAAPAHHVAQHTTQAKATGSGFCFVVEGLDYATTYAYTITAKDTEDKVVESYNGTFTTKAPTSTEDVRSAQSQPAVCKVFRNGQVYIIRGDKTYTAIGSQL